MARPARQGCRLLAPPALRLPSLCPLSNCQTSPAGSTRALSLLELFNNASCDVQRCDMASPAEGFYCRAGDCFHTMSQHSHQETQTTKFTHRPTNGKPCCLATGPQKHDSTHEVSLNPLQRAAGRGNSRFLQARRAPQEAKCGQARVD